jgi:hypothetical protein
VYPHDHETAPATIPQDEHEAAPATIPQLAALPLLTPQSRVGGLAGLQVAIILDSTGNGEAAQKLYRQLQGHAVAAVARKSKQMLFGFKAAKFLKVRK